jgi:hypothetical protein
VGFQEISGEFAVNEVSLKSSVISQLSNGTRVTATELPTAKLEELWRVVNAADDEGAQLSVGSLSQFYKSML